MAARRGDIGNAHRVFPRICGVAWMPMIHSISTDGPARAGHIGAGACLPGVDIGATDAALAPAGVPQASAWCISLAPLPNIGQF
jgi:hypothetical protein